MVEIIKRNLCNKYINYGIIFRIILTIITLFIIYSYRKNINIKKYFYLILPIILTILDVSDNICIKLKNPKCTKTFYYQYCDKIHDSITYLLFFLIFNLDNYFLLFLIWRIIGVILFCITKKGVYLIFMFDFMKEYLLYLFIFGKNYIYLPIFIFFKICFEYYFHTIHNKHQYIK